MKPNPSQPCRRRVIAPLLLAVFVTTQAGAIERGQLAGGVVYAAGGIGQDEAAALHAERDRYSLWVATVARPSGAYLTDVRLHIEPLDGHRPAIDVVMPGPWLLVDLPLGRYRVTGTWMTDAVATAQTQSEQVTIHPGDHHQVVFRFAVTADVAPERKPQFGGNPFGTDGNRAP